MHTAAAAPNKAADVVGWAHDFLRLTWDEVGGMLGTTGRTVQRWRDHEMVPSRESEERLDAADELRFWLRTVFAGDEAAAREWLHTRLLDLRGKTPMHAIKAGQLAKISEFLATFHSGAFI
ncbi:MAG TPA: antitoxin Xre/MbcA/ParS toxin-binding domain-containing protein [Longimicrobiales bacterium]|nr:antitoxin Xre/MbcA/ParS toxin-binding domain-containing protein [Longimicrobiales bacterium]